MPPLPTQKTGAPSSTPDAGWQFGFDVGVAGCGSRSSGRVLMPIGEM